MSALAVFNAPCGTRSPSQKGIECTSSPVCPGNSKPARNSTPGRQNRPRAEVDAPTGGASKPASEWPRYATTHAADVDGWTTASFGQGGLSSFVLRHQPKSSQLHS